MSNFVTMNDVAVHKKLVTAALRHVICIEDAEEIVNSYYNSLPESVQLLVVHDDPLGLAYNLVSDRNLHYVSDARDKFNLIRDKILEADHVNAS